MGDESIEHFCTCLLMESKRMGGVLFNLVDDGKEAEMSMREAQ